MKNIKKNLLTVGVVVIISVAATSAVFASNFKGLNHPLNKNGRSSMIGTVLSINGDILSVTTKAKNINYTVDVTGAKLTKGFGKNAQTLNLTDIKVGDMVEFNGTISGNSVKAVTFADLTGMNAQAKAPHFEGKITALNGSSFTIQKNGFKKASGNSTTTYTVNSTGSTIFKKDGQVVALSDLAVNQNVTVLGTLDQTTNTISATTVNVMTKNGLKLGFLKKGKVGK